MSAAHDLGYSLRRYFIDAYQSREVATWESGIRVLDIGGHKTQKRGRFDLSRFGFRVTCLNLTPDKRPDVLGDAALLPFVAGCFDAVVCAELLEHVYDPRRVVGEMARVLRPGGRVVITVPFLVQVHGDPDDYGRYTGSFWSRALVDQGFDDVQIERHGQFWSVQLDAMRAWLTEMRRVHPRRRWWFPIVTRLLVWGRARAIRREARETDPASTLRHFTTGFGITARKRIS